MPVTIEVYDILGKTFLILEDQKLLNAGHYTVYVGSNQLPSGRYVYSLRAGGKVLSKEMTIVK